MPDGPRGAVVRIDAHPAGTQDHPDPLDAHLGNGGGHALHAVPHHLTCRHGNAKGGQLALHHRGECVLDQPLGHLAAGCDNPSGLYPPGQQLQQRPPLRQRLGPAQRLIRDDQGDHPGAAQLVPTADSRVAVAGCDHHVPQQVDGVQPPGIHPEQSIHGCGQLQLALLDLAAGHALVFTQGAQPCRTLVLMDHSGDHLPDIQVLLAHGEQDRDVFLAHYMALAEPGVLGYAGDNLGHVVAQHMAHRLLCPYQLHRSASFC